MICFENLKQTTDASGNDIIVTQQVILTEDNSMDYMELDVLLSDNNDNETLGDILSDHTGSFSNNILGFTDWTQLKPCLKACLKACQQVINPEFTLADRLEDALNSDDIHADIEKILQELRAQKLKIR